MKTTHIILAAVLAAASAIQAATAEHKLPAPMPEFMNQEQLTKWQADRIAKAQANTSVETFAKQANLSTSAFYTGKPYIAETGSYGFMFRQYDPELNRWTTHDPSGYPDGPNNSAYSATPTYEYDWQGLVTGKISYTWNASSGGTIPITYGATQDCSADFKNGPKLIGKEGNIGCSSGSVSVSVAGANISGAYEVGNPAVTITSVKASDAFTIGDATLITWSYDAVVQSSFKVTFSGTVGVDISYEGVDIKIGASGSESYIWQQSASVSGFITVAE